MDYNVRHACLHNCNPDLKWLKHAWPTMYVYKALKPRQFEDMTGLVFPDHSSGIVDGIVTGLHEALHATSKHSYRPNLQRCQSLEKSSALQRPCNQTCTCAPHACRHACPHVFSFSMHAGLHACMIACMHECMHARLSCMHFGTHEGLGFRVSYLFRIEALEFFLRFRDVSLMLKKPCMMHAEQSNKT